MPLAPVLIKIDHWIQKRNGALGVWHPCGPAAGLHGKQKSIRMNNTFPIDESVARVAESVSPSSELQNSLDEKALKEDQDENLEACLNSDSISSKPHWGICRGMGYIRAALWAQAASRTETISPGQSF
jgi:hypothetical protein